MRDCNSYVNNAGGTRYLRRSEESAAGREAGFSVAKSPISEVSYRHRASILRTVTVWTNPASAVSFIGFAVLSARVLVMRRESRIADRCGGALDWRPMRAPHAWKHFSDCDPVARRMMKRDFYARYSPAILLIAVFLLPISFAGARCALHSNQNRVEQWLPDQYEETQVYHGISQALSGRRIRPGKLGRLHA